MLRHENILGKNLHIIHAVYVPLQMRRGSVFSCMRLFLSVYSETIDLETSCSRSAIHKLVKMLICLCVWMLTRVAQIVTAAHRGL